MSGIFGALNINDTDRVYLSTLGQQVIYDALQDLLNRYNTCWRWLADREDSPWYPSARLFRQDATREWSPVIARVAAAWCELSPIMKLSNKPNTIPPSC